jgi:hypothetical protein
VKKGGASQNCQQVAGKGKAFANGNGKGHDALGMALGFHVSKTKTAAKSFEDVVVCLFELGENVSQYAGFLFRSTHDGVSLKR